MRILTLTDVFFPDTVSGAGRVAYHLNSELSLKEIEEVLCDTTRRSRWAPQACRDYVEEHFSWHRMANIFEQVAKRLVRRGN